MYHHTFSKFSRLTQISLCLRCPVTLEARIIIVRLIWASTLTVFWIHQLVKAFQAMQRVLVSRPHHRSLLGRNSNPLERPLIFGDDRPAAKESIRWVRLISFDGVLLQARYLFCVLGATTPSTDATTMAGLMLPTQLRIPMPPRKSGISPAVTAELERIWASSFPRVRTTSLRL